MLEMGARGIGHIRYLAGLTPPKVGLVLNVGSAHIGEFGGREQIAQAKGELVESLPPAEEGAPPSSTRTTPRTGHGIPYEGEGDPFRRVRRSGRLCRERATHGQRTAFLQASHTLRCIRCDHAPVR
ncbi:hypothetical protein SHKM778_71310 [Streptomyces sp. KM77-8]|uniref:Mur ligase central domain-containing protein n=1 Tax=Streptomyces haneummycinicus TaxID=3074435 RepID=A0AAT9HTY0_9ACTN